MWFQKNNPAQSTTDKQIQTLLKQYETIFKNTEDAIFLIKVVDEKDFIFIQTNKSHQERTGITPEMIVNKTPYELLGKDLGDIVANNYRRCVNERKRVEYTEKLNLPAGTKTWRTTLTPVFDENNKIIYIVGISYDITEQENYLIQLRKINEKLNAILETSPDGIAIIDIVGKILFASDQIAEMLGFNKRDAKSLKGKNIRDFISEKSAEQFKTNLSILLQKGSFDKPYVYEFLDKNKHIRFAEVKSKLLKGPEGQVESILVIARDITDRLAIEKEKEKSQTKYQILFENSPSGILLIGEDGTILDANTAFLKLSGFRKDELVGKHCSTLSKEDTNNPIKDNISRIIDGEHLVHEVTNIRKDGSKIHLLLNEQAIELDNGQKVILSISSDITELKEKERQLKDSELLFRTIADYSFDWIYLIDMDFSIKYMSPSVERVTGYTKKDFEDDIMLFLNIIHPEDREHFLSKHQIDENNNYVFSSEPIILEYRILTKDGNIKYISHSCAPIFDNDGNFFGRRVTNRDITQLVRQREEFKIEKEKLENLIDGIKVGTWEWEIKTGKLKVNNYWASILGYSLEELEPITLETFNSLTHPHDLEQVYSQVDLHFNGKIDLLELEIRMRHKDGRWIWIWDRGKLIKRDKDGNPELMIGVHIDISKQKEFEEEIKKTLFDLQETRKILEESLFERNELIEDLTQTKEKLEKINSEKDKFFSIIAHDLRSPLSSFVGLTKILSEELGNFEQDELQEMLVELRNSSSNVYKLLENLLEWSRLQRGVIKFEPESVDLAYFIDQNIALLKEAANLKNIKLSNLIDRKCYIEADPTMLNTIMRNLLSNAIKFTPRNGEVKIGAYPSEDGNYAVIYVQDTGIGIEKENIDKIFSIEHKVNRPGTEGEPSSGLGLLLCKEFIEKHQGKIWVESEVGKGTTFYFTMKKSYCD